jgi:hypothetical protein
MLRLHPICFIRWTPAVPLLVAGTSALIRAEATSDCCLKYAVFVRVVKLDVIASRGYRN